MFLCADFQMPHATYAENKTERVSRIACEVFRGVSFDIFTKMNISGFKILDLISEVS